MRDKERRYNGNEEWGDAEKDNGEIMLNEPIGTDSVLLCLTYCDRVGIILLVMSCLLCKIACGS